MFKKIESVKVNVEIENLKGSDNMNTFLKYDSEDKNNKKIFYKICSYKNGEWKKHKVETEQEIVPFIERIFEEETIYKVVKHNIDYDVSYATIFNKADLEDLRSEILNEQLNKDKILENYYT